MFSKCRNIRSLVINFNNYVDSFIVKHSWLSIILVYNTVSLVVIAALYFLIPVFMCYDGNFIETNKAVGFSYNLQFLAGALMSVVFGTLILGILFKDINRWNNLVSYKEVDFHTVKKIREKCISLPYKIYICQILALVFSAIVISIVARAVLMIRIGMILRLISIIFSFAFLSAVISYTFSKKIFTKILNDTYIYSCVEGFRVDIKSKMLLQIIPMVITTILLTAILGYSQIIEEKGNVLFETYKLQLSEKLKDSKNIKSPENLFAVLSDIRLKDVKTTYFAVSPEGSIITSDGSLVPPKLRYFMNNPSDGNRVYGDTKEIQGVVQRVEIGGQSWAGGIKFEVSAHKAVSLFIMALIVLLLVNSYVIYCFSKSISNDISHVAKSLTKIGEGRSSEAKREIPVISNDEIGDLIVAFNKLQQYEMKYDKMKNEFFSNVSHELRTPLNIILTSTQLLHNLKENNDDSIERISGVIKQNGYRLLRLVNNLIDTSKISASFYDLHMKNCNIISVVEEISLSVANYIKELDVNFMFDTEIEERIMACDTDLIERIILNLLSNAVKFTSPGGNIFVYMYEENNNIVISVKDSGIGMTPEDKNMIFERFKQVDKSLARKREGSGIGLSLVKLLVEMHNGSIKVKSELGKGSEFIVALPIIVLDEQEEINYLDKQIIGGRVLDSMDKIKIEFSDIYS
jgi:signal transduction histidine kinase